MKEDLIICRCEEVTLKDIMDAIHAGASTVNSIKRRTRAGMGLCQGKTCGRLVAQILSQKLGIELGKIEPARCRPPIRPIRIGIFSILLTLMTILSFPSLILSDQWINPKDVIKDPMIARLQQERKELTKLEKDEIRKYGYTGLELMTYVDANAEQGRDYDAFFHVMVINRLGHISAYAWLERGKFYYKNRQSLLAHDGIKPGDVEYKKVGIQTYPPSQKGFGYFDLFFLTAEKNLNKKDVYIWDPRARKIRHVPSGDKEDRWFFGVPFSYDDHEFREAWEEEHRILGKDNIRGHECFVIESKNRINLNYYLAKRATWVETENFLDLHEEQFDRAGKLSRIFDKYWERIKPWNYWVKGLWDAVDLGTKDRAYFQSHDWIFDQGYKDVDFQVTAIEKENFWRRPKNSPPLLKKASDLPKVPTVRWEFWQKLGIKPTLK